MNDIEYTLLILCITLWGILGLFFVLLFIGYIADKVNL